MKVLGEGRFALLQILSVWQNWFDFKPDTIIKNHQLEILGTRVKYLDHEKRAYKHEILSYRISKIHVIAHSGVSRETRCLTFSTCILCLCEKRKPRRGHAYMQARRSLRHTPM